MKCGKRGLLAAARYGPTTELSIATYSSLPARNREEKKRTKLLWRGVVNEMAGREKIPTTRT